MCVSFRICCIYLNTYLPVLYESELRTQLCSRSELFCGYRSWLSEISAFDTHTCHFSLNLLSNESATAHGILNIPAFSRYICSVLTWRHPCPVRLRQPAELQRVVASAERLSWQSEAPSRKRPRLAQLEPPPPLGWVQVVRSSSEAESGDDSAQL